jgi:hypothetical protein
LGVGVALWGAAAWVRYRERKPGTTVASALIIGLVVFFFHLAGFCFYALLVGCYEVFAILDRGTGPRSWIRTVAMRMPIAAVPFLLPVALYRRSALSKIPGVPIWPTLSEKAWGLLVSFIDYSVTLDILLVAPVIGFLLFCAFTGKVKIAKPGALCAAILLLAYLALPASFKTVWQVDLRLMVMFGFMLFVAFLPVGLTPRTETIATSALALLILAKIAFITGVWVHSQQDVRNTREVITHVQPGSRVLNVNVLEGDNPSWFAAMPRSRRIPHLNATYWHLGSLVLLDRRAFWQTIFAIDEQQPIRVREPYLEDILDTKGAVPSYKLLALHSLQDREKQRFPYLPGWQQKYDYVLLLNADGAGDLNNFLPDKLELLDRRGIAALFRVKQSVNAKGQ